MSPLCIRPEAELDIFEASIWYENEREGLGEVFVGAVRSTLQRVELGPEQFPLVLKDIRRALVRRFPFAVFFVQEERRSTVIAVTHLHRHPGSWADRR